MRMNLILPGGGTLRRTYFVPFVVLGLFGLAGCSLNRAPIAVLRAPAISGPAPLEVLFDLSYCEDPDGDRLSYVLDFADDSAPLAGDEFGVIVRHTYERSGTFAARLTVTDSVGGRSTDGLAITVSEEGPPVGLEVGKTAPDFTARRTDGGTATLSDFRGKVVLLEFWGAWCPPCRASMPRLADLCDEFGERGLVALTVSTDEEEEDAIVFLEENGYTEFVSLWEPGGKKNSPLTQLYGVSSSDVGIPRTFLLDRQGVIRYVGHPADLDPGAVEALL